MFEIACFCCRDKNTRNPFKMLPRSLYSPEEMTCTQCSYTGRVADFVQHTMTHCPGNAFPCKWCKQPIMWGNLNLVELEHHIESHCTRVPCGYKSNLGERCPFEGTKAEACECFKSHPVRNQLFRNVKKALIRATPEQLPNYIIDWDLFNKQTPTQDQVNQYREQIKPNEFKAGDMVPDTDDEEGSDSDSDDELDN